PSISGRIRGNKSGQGIGFQIGISVIGLPTEIGQLKSPIGTLGEGRGMKRISGMILTLAAVCGCATTGGPAGQAHTAGSWGASPQQGSSTKVAKTVPNAVGPWGDPAAQTQDANVTQASAKSSAAATSMKHFQHVEVVPEPPKPPFGFYQNNVLY